MNSEFDQYASSYSDLLSDPLRDRFAASEKFFHARKWALIRDFLKRSRRDPAALSWLDAGCGQGQLLDIAGSSFRQAVGCDPSQEMIGGATSGRQVHHQPSAAELPFPDESFDFVTAVCVFHHVHGADRTLLTDSIRRVLKPDGVFCMIEHNPWNPMTQLIVRRCPVDQDAELLPSPLAARLMRHAGLQIIATKYFLYCPESLFRVVGGVESYLEKVPLGGQYAVFGRRPAHA